MDEHTDLTTLVRSAALEEQSTAPPWDGVARRMRALRRRRAQRMGALVAIVAALGVVGVALAQDGDGDPTGVATAGDPDHRESTTTEVAPSTTSGASPDPTVDGTTVVPSTATSTPQSTVPTTTSAPPAAWSSLVHDVAAPLPASLDGPVPEAYPAAGTASIDALRTVGDGSTLLVVLLGADHDDPASPCYEGYVPEVSYSAQDGYVVTLNAHRPPDPTPPAGQDCAYVAQYRMVAVDLGRVYAGEPVIDGSSGLAQPVFDGRLLPEWPAPDGLVMRWEYPAYRDEVSLLGWVMTWLQPDGSYDGSIELTISDQALEDPTDCPRQEVRGVLGWRCEGGVYPVFVYWTQDGISYGVRAGSLDEALAFAHGLV
jgi:hypothetical protein